MFTAKTPDVSSCQRQILVRVCSRLQFKIFICVTRAIVGNVLRNPPTLSLDVKGPSVLLSSPFYLLPSKLKLKLCTRRTDHTLENLLSLAA